MGFPHATLVMSIETTAGGIRVKRELEDGWFQNVEMPLPALLTIQSGAAKLRYATLMGIKKAKSKEIKRIGAPPAAASSLKLERIYPVSYTHLPQSLRSVYIGGRMASAVEQKVKQIIVEQLGVDESQVDNKASFVDDLGADSLDIVELVMAFEEAFELEIPDEDAEKIGTVGDAVTYIENKKK